VWENQERCHYTKEGGSRKKGLEGLACKAQKAEVATAGHGEENYQGLSDWTRKLKEEAWGVTD